MEDLIVRLLAPPFQAVRMDANYLELIGLAIVLRISRVHPHWGHHFFRHIESVFFSLARRRRLAVLAVGVAAIIVRLAILPVAPVPSPTVADEFSHLLLADTLSHGRLTNPAHPLWKHFETMHVIQRPTYNSMYFPAQGLFLAAGKLLTNSAWVGVLLSVALCCMAVCWATQAWLPPGWALFGGALAVIRFGLLGYWVNSYWGGAVTALGGALVIGAWPRVSRNPRIRHGVVLGAGLALLALSRPFEGVVLALPVAVFLVVSLRRRNRAFVFRWGSRVAVPLLLVLVISATWLCFYNWRVTGDAFKPPYLVNKETYGWPLTLPWLTVKPCSHNHEVLSAYYSWEVSEHQKIKAPLQNALQNSLDVVPLWSFYLGPILTVPFLLFFGRVLRDRRIRPVLICLAAVASAVAMEQSRYPHYLSPATAGITIVVLQCFRHMRVAGCRQNPRALFLVRALPLMIVVTLAVRAGVPALRGTTGFPDYLSWCSTAPNRFGRTTVMARLNEIAGDHLVIVRYDTHEKFMNDWVHNEADIDRARIVWARDMGSAGNAELVRYFSNRTAWIVNAGDHPPRLLHYVPAADESRAELPRQGVGSAHGATASGDASRSIAP